MATLIACSPGGGVSNVLTVIAGGTVTFSAAVTVILQGLAVVTMPFWLFVLTSAAGVDDVEIALVRAPGRAFPTYNPMNAASGPPFR